MSDFNVDTADRAALDAAAADLGISVPGNTKDDTLRAKIKAALGDVTPGGDQPEAIPPAAEEKAPAKRKRFEIIVATHEQDKQPVQVGVNGKNYVIQRGKKVIVPASVVEVLNNAIRHEFDPETMEENHVSAYPFQIVREITE